MKQRFLVIASALLMALIPTGCNGNNPEQSADPSQQPAVSEDPSQEPSDLKKLKADVPVTGDWVFEETPTFTLELENPNEVDVTADVKLAITTDMKEQVTTESFEEAIPSRGDKSVSLTTSLKLDPGFYSAKITVNGRVTKVFTFGISPTRIVSPPDKQDDYDTFWQDAKDQLAAIDMNPVLTEVKEYSTSARKVYLVELQSIPDGLSGDPVTVCGYYVQPLDGKQHPVIMHFYGYDDQNPSGKMYCPSGGYSADYAEFYLSTRGQMINNRTADKRSDGIQKDYKNNYGDWFAFHFGDKDSYYYRGAFMDCVQAVRFMSQQETSDITNLYAEGASQGGALTYAAAALSDFPFTAIAPCVAFLGDFPDYFKIVSWPGDTAKNHKGSMTDSEMYAFLSYFDTKNLATRISCPVIASSCLQDGTCPPHTNLAPYNNLLSTEKEIHFYPLLQHEIPSDWPDKTMAWFESHREEAVLK